MRPAIFVLLASALCFSVSASERMELRLWPYGLPDGATVLSAEEIAKLKAAEAAPPKDNIQRVRVVTDPSLIVYPASEPNGCGMLVCPGGGYRQLTYDMEGTEIAEWLNTLGVTAVLVRYRVPRTEEPRHAEPLQDLQRAIRLTRHHARDWGIDPNRLGAIGFSAGGHLVVMSGVHWKEQTYAPVDEADRLSCRPDFLAPIYPGGLSDDDNDRLSPLVQVTNETPPAFISVTADDWCATGATLFFQALSRAEVPAELHVFARGGHGYGLRPKDKPVGHWTQLCENWLRDSGFLERTGSDSVAVGEP